MKNSNFNIQHAVKLILLISIGTFFSNCRKDNLINPNHKLESTNAQRITPEISDGSMSFKNEEQLYAYLDQCAKLNEKQIASFEKTINFRSLGTLYNEICKSENENQENYYSGQNPDLTIAEYQQLGLNYENSSIYKKYLDLGIIQEEIEKDGAKSFQLFIDNPGFLYVLNENGCVFAGNKKYVFEGSELQISDKSTGEVINNVSFISKATSNWSQGGAWEYDGSNKRFSYKVYGTCITSSDQSPSGLIESVFYVQALGQNKKFGSWAGRADYLPVYSFSGSWSSSYTAKACLACANETNPVALSDGAFSSPYSWSSTSDPNGQTNNFFRYLKPNGSWALSGYYITSPFNLSYNLAFSFSGGSSGYNRYLYR